MKFVVFVLLYLLQGNSIAQIDYIPKLAYAYRDTIYVETTTYFNDVPHYNYIPSLIERESCKSLTNSKCWNPSSRLKTRKEEGAGLGQLTRAYSDDGSIRFDALNGLNYQYPKQLSQLSWGNVYTRPDLQIRAMTLMLKDSYKQLYNVTDLESRLQMTDAAYNGGMRDLLKERRTCGLAKDCDPNIWFDNVEKYCVKSKKALYGNISACDINRHHVRDVYLSNLPKYKKGYFNLEYLSEKKAQGVVP
jgi:hypothetical protein